MNVPQNFNQTIDISSVPADSPDAGRRRQELHPDLVAATIPDDGLLALDAALARLAGQDPVKAQLVALHYFASLTGDQAARVLGISAGTADRYLANYRAWIRREMDADDAEPKNPPKILTPPKLFRRIACRLELSLPGNSI